jgi:2,5-diamino-6-(ribosylamino)-4(3H)-pyrimidinone 5'-phosphate reductase
MKPYVICHMIMSLDGRIVSSRWQLSPAGRAEYEATAATYQSNAWMCGRVTMAGFANGTPPAPAATAPAIAKTDYLAPDPQTSFAIALDPAGKLYWARNEIGGDHLVTVLTEKVSNDYLGHLRTAGVSYLFAGRDRIDLPMVLDKLVCAFPIKTLLLEGGGKINGAMLQAGLIDELSLLIAPFADGSTGTPTLFDMPPTSGTPKPGTAALNTSGGALLNTPASRWKLRSIEQRADDIIWLRYSFR